MAVVRGESKELKNKLRTKQKKRLLYDDIHGESLICAIWVRIILYVCFCHIKSARTPMFRFRCSPQ